MRCLLNHYTNVKKVTVTFAHTLENAIKALEVANIVIPNKSANLPSVINKEVILNAIKKVETFVAMKKVARNKLTTNNIELKANDDKGTLEVHIKDHGKTKRLSLTGFKNIKNEKESSFLSTGALIGIATGSIFGIGIIGYLIYYFLKSKK